MSAPHRDGSTFAPELDGERLSTQHFRVLVTMYDGKWRGLLEIAQDAGLSVASLPGISARLRDFRKPRFGGHTVERRRIAGGLFEYRLLIRFCEPLEAEPTRATQGVSA